MSHREDQFVAEVRGRVADMFLLAGLTGVSVEPRMTPEYFLGKDEKPEMPAVIGAFFNGWFRVSSDQGSFNFGFVVEDVPAFDLTDSGVTTKEILYKLGDPYGEAEHISEKENFFIPAMNMDTVRAFIDVLKSKKH